MPTREEILAGLTWLANEYTGIAIAWHILLFILIAMLFAGWKPGNNVMILVLTSLALSASFFASLQGNFFNASVFALLVITSVFATLKPGKQLMKGDKPGPDIIGLLLIIFGLVYPEFLNVNSLLEYVYAAPVGLIPCPTLAILVGFALVYREFGSVIWTTTLVIAGLFYGLFGALYLKVYLDWVLVAGSCILLLNSLYVRIKRPSFHHES